MQKGIIKDYENRIKLLKRQVKKHNNTLQKQRYQNEQQKQNILNKISQKENKIQEFETQICNLYIDQEKEKRSQVVDKLKQFVKNNYPNLIHKIYLSKSTGSIYLYLYSEGTVSKTIRFSGHYSTKFKKTYDLGLINNNRELRKVIDRNLRILQYKDVCKKIEEIKTLKEKNKC